MKEVVTINGLSKWNGEFVDKVTGEKITGTPYTKLFFTSKTESVSENKRGYFETSYKGDYGIYQKLATIKLPVLLEIEITVIPGSKGAEIWVLDAIPSQNQKAS